MQLCINKKPLKTANIHEFSVKNGIIIDNADSLDLKKNFSINT